MGGAATRELLKRGWEVRAVTRKPESEKTKTNRTKINTPLFKILLLIFIKYI